MSFKLGLCIPKGKKSRIRLPDIIKNLCKAADIEIVEIDMKEDIEIQGPFHVLLHKVLDYYNEFDVVIADQKITKLMSYALQHKEMIVIDNFDWCFKLTNRKYMVELLKSCEFYLNGVKVFLPNTIEITEHMTIVEVHRLLKKRSVKFPVVSKSISAYFEEDARQMSLFFSTEAIFRLKKPCLLQEFCNHGGVMYKVFVVGSKFNICMRPSIRDLYETDTNTTLCFDSSRVSKTGYPYMKGIHPVDPNKRHWANSDEVSDLLDSDVLKEVMSRIHANTGLYLYGFDILVERETGNYALIDINHFPSYAGIDSEHFPNDLVGLLKTFRDIPGEIL